MNTTTSMDEVNELVQEKPGSQLAKIREAKGLSQEYVAGKLHLRVRIIELLEADNYLQMPEPVFIKGYLRAYARLLDVAPEPLLDTFNAIFSIERKCEKALWQGRRENNRSQRVVRWTSALITVVAIVAASLWWQKNKDVEAFPLDKSAEAKAEASVDTQVKLTDLSRMQSMFSVNGDSATETKGG